MPLDRDDVDVEVRTLKRLVNLLLLGLEAMGWLAFLIGFGELSRRFILRYQRLEVVGDSMEPTLSNGDKIIVRRGVAPISGSLIVFADPRERDRLLVKRAQSVSAGEVVAMGDNADASTDSRHFGLIPVSELVGVAFYRYFPAKSAGRI